MSPKKLFRSLNSKKSKAALTGFLMSFAVFTVLNFHSNTIASTLDELNKVKEKVKQYSNQTQEAKEDVSTLQGRINRISSDISNAQKQISSLEGQIKSTQSAIASKNKAIANKEKELELQQIHQNEIIKTIYETNDQDTVLMLAGSGSITDIINHAEYLETLESDIELTIRTVEGIKTELQEEKTTLEEKKEELAGLKAQQQAYRAGLVSEKNTQDELKSEAQRQLNTYSQQLADAKKQQAQLEAELAAINRRLSSGAIQARDRGVSAVGFQWPTNYRYITTYFGGSTPFQGFHSGLDLANSMGTPIVAASSGTVLMATSMRYANGTMYGYGNYIVVGHNARYSSRYAHLSSFAVSPGQEVRRGQVIGYMGSTGWSTGPHLHFEIHDYNRAVNPLSFLP